MLRLRELRTESGLTQKELGKKTNSTSKNIWAYENNFATPPLDVLMRFADFFGVSIDYLVGRSDDFGNISIATNGQELPAQEKELLQMYRSLDKKLQELARVYLQKLVALNDDGLSSGKFHA